MQTDTEIEARLNYLRGEIQHERISYGEIVELQSLADHIDPGDVLLLKWAGVPEAEHKRVKRAACPLIVAMDQHGAGYASVQEIQRICGECSNREPPLANGKDERKT